MLAAQQSCFTNISSYQEYVVAATGCTMPQVIVKRSKPFVDGEFLKECSQHSTDFMCLEKKELFEKQHHASLPYSIADFMQQLYTLYFIF